MAYGAGVQVPDGVVILGGTDGKTSIPWCFFVGRDGKCHRTVTNFPQGLDNFAATYHDGMLWVAGGQTNGVPNRNVYRLKWPCDTTINKWHVAATLPDICRLQPCMAEQ